jgi:hypothetical protein
MSDKALNPIAQLSPGGIFQDGFSDMGKKLRMNPYPTVAAIAAFSTFEK